MPVFLDGVGLFGPGLPAWNEATLNLLSGTIPYLGGELAAFSALPLPPNAARRAGFSSRLALEVAAQALAVRPARREGAEVATVFACSGGDTEALHRILTALCEEGHPVSPNQFSNSVHNAPAGYWSIATASMAASVSLSAYDASFSAGLLEAYSSVVVLRKPVLLVVYDMPPPRPLLPHRRVPVAFATALLLTAEARRTSRCRLSVSLAENDEEDRLADVRLERLRLANPAARGLPLLRRIALNSPGLVRLPYLCGAVVSVDCQPC